MCLPKCNTDRQQGFIWRFLADWSACWIDLTAACERTEGSHHAKDVWAWMSVRQTKQVLNSCWFTDNWYCWVNNIRVIIKQWFHFSKGRQDCFWLFWVQVKDLMKSLTGAEVLKKTTEWLSPGQQRRPVVWFWRWLSAEQKPSPPASAYCHRDKLWVRIYRWWLLGSALWIRATARLKTIKS